MHVYGLRMRSHSGPIPECTLCVKFSSIEHLLKHILSVFVCCPSALSLSHSSEPGTVSTSPLPTLTLKAEQEEGQHPLRRFFPSWYVPLSSPPTPSHTQLEIVFKHRCGSLPVYSVSLHRFVTELNCFASPEDENSLRTRICLYNLGHNDTPST